MTFLSFLFPLFLAFFVGCESTIKNSRPVIGILQLPKYGPKPDYKVTHNYIAASYVKWVESGGARVVPLEISLHPQSLNSTLDKVSGVLFTGGGVDFEYEPYFGTLTYVTNYLKMKHDKYNVSIPIWSTCLGFEALITVTAGGLSNFERDTCDCHNETLPVMFHGKESIIFTGNRGQMAHDIFSKEHSTQNEHGRCIFPTTFQQHSALTETFDVLGTSFTNNKKEFITLIQSKPGKAPMYGSQFHPEKPAYEWVASHPIPRNDDVIFSNFYLASFFAKEARKCVHKMTDEMYEELSIYNTEVTYTHDYYEQMYLFHLPKSTIDYHETEYNSKVLNEFDLME